MICDFGMCDGVWRLGASNGRYSSHTNGTNNKVLALFMVALFHPSFLTSARFLPGVRGRAGGNPTPAAPAPPTAGRAKRK